MLQFSLNLYQKDFKYDIIYSRRGETMFEKKYKVKDLHIVWLGKVKKLNKGELQLNSIENPYVIVNQ